MRPLRALLIAIGFATRVPVRLGAVQPNELAEGLTTLPIVGFAIGGLCFGLFTLCDNTLGTTLAAVATVAVSASVTGGLHLDGLADWFDALGGGRGNRDRMLEIMRDSRIGAHGAVALVLLLLAKVAAIAELPESQRLLALVAAPAAARLGAVWLLYILPAARPDGLGRGMGEDLNLGHALAASAGFALGAVWLGPSWLWPGFATSLTTAALGWHAKLRLGGVTGDVCGASVELSELAFVVACRAYGLG